MAKATNNPLANLDLTGLKDIRVQAKTGKAKVKGLAMTEAVEAAPTPKPAPGTLGMLAALEGEWEGTGFNLIEIPNMNQKPGTTPPADKFRLTLNSTFETMTINAIKGDIINRGNIQDDVAYRGLHYLQQVTDVVLNEGIHLETGLFLNLPTGDPKVQVAGRLGSIPHGDSLLAQGSVFEVNGGPFINTELPTPAGSKGTPAADPTPFTIENGKRKNDTSAEYLALLNNAIPPNGIDKAVIMNPNLLLKSAIEGLNITKTIVILLDANPVDGVSNVASPVGGITNIPFIEKNANATSLTAIFWIETVQNADGSTDTLLQYTQTVILDFPVFGTDPTKVVPIKWPHISVATLKKKK